MRSALARLFSGLSEKEIPGFINLSLVVKPGF
jgi:hypothetical protein